MPKDFRLSRYVRATLETTSPSSHPSSTKGTNKGQAWLYTFTEGSRRFRWLSYAPLPIVALVPITPILPFLVFAIASLAPGSITPMIGSENLSFNASRLKEDAVLQATTAILTSKSCKKLILSIENFVIVSLDFVP